MNNKRPWSTKFELIIKTKYLIILKMLNLNLTFIIIKQLSGIMLQVKQYLHNHDN